MKTVINNLIFVLAVTSLLLSFPQKALSQDRDGDGHAAVEHGGDDCDDGDPNRFPGNTEIADRENHDEDCDPSTFANDDKDGDGFLPSWACNEAGDGTLNCGRDCDDTDPTVNPHQMDICNRRDDNCDGNIDEDQPCQMLQKWSKEAKAKAQKARKERRINEMTEKANIQEHANNPAVQQAVSNDLEANLKQNANNTPDENACFNAVQGKIAWDQTGVNTQWSPSNVNKLCEGAETSEQPARCFQKVLHGNVATGEGLNSWNWGQAIALCRGTSSAKKTILCYKSGIAKGRSHQEAVKACRE